MKKCICKVKEKTNFDTSKKALALGMAIHIFALTSIGFAFGTKAPFIYAGILLGAFVLMSGYFVNMEHSVKCSTRRSIIKILDLGTFFF